MELTGLRELIDTCVVARYGMVRHSDIPSLCESLGMLAPPPRQDPQSGRDITKHERLQASLTACPDNQLPAVARAVLGKQQLDAEHRNALQDLLWQNTRYVEILGRTRREIAASFHLADHIRHPDHFLAMLDSLWMLDDDLLDGWGGAQRSLRAEINPHVIRNPDDWDAEYLFERLGCFEAPHPRFGRFLEALAAARTLQSEPAQRRFVDMADENLRAVGAQLHEVGAEDGYPLFELIQNGQAPSRRPRQIIFATRVKPDIRVSSVLDGDLEVIDRAEQADEVLVYDCVIGNDGLRWQDLLSWWQETRGIDKNEDARASLFQRMRMSLPDRSPG
jgi:hypothetical protein